MNKVIICGRLGQDPEVKNFDGGSVTKFSVATTSKWKNKAGELQEETTWHNIDVWAGLGELCSKYLSKGRQVLVEGSLHTRKYEKNGVNCYATSIKAHNVQFLGSSKDSAESTNAAAPSELPNHAPEPSFDTNEDLPF